jgi:hypothetical protein
MKKYIWTVLPILFMISGTSQGQSIFYVSLEPDQPGCCDDIINKIDEKFRSQPTIYKVADYSPFNHFVENQQASLNGRQLFIRGYIHAQGLGYEVRFEVKDLVRGKYIEIRNSGRTIPTKAPSKWLNWVSLFQEDVLYYKKNGRVKIYVLVEPIVCLEDISPIDAHNLKKMFSSYTQLLNSHESFKRHFWFVESDATVPSKLSPIATSTRLNSPFVIPVLDPPIQFIANVAIEPSFANIEKLPTNLRDSLWLKYSRIQH